MTRLLRATAILACATLIGGCGDDESGGGTSTVEDPATVQGGKTLGQKSSELTGLSAGVDEAGAKAPLTSVGNQLMAWVGQWQAAKAQEKAGGAGAPGGGTPGGPGAAGYPQTADATVNFQDGHLSANVSYDGPQAQVRYTVEMDITETETGSVIDGTFALDFSAMSVYSVAYEYRAVYDALTLEAGCPVGGSISVDYAFSISGDAFDQIPADQRAQIEDQVGGSGTLTASFGPTCGDAAVEGN